MGKQQEGSHGRDRLKHAVKKTFSSLLASWPGASQESRKHDSRKKLSTLNGNTSAARQSISTASTKRSSQRTPLTPSPNPPPPPPAAAAASSVVPRKALCERRGGSRPHIPLTATTTSSSSTTSFASIIPDRPPPSLKPNPRRRPSSRRGPNKISPDCILHLPLWRQQLLDITHPAQLWAAQPCHEMPDELPDEAYEELPILRPATMERIKRGYPDPELDAGGSWDWRRGGASIWGNAD
ncbi:hypothetical protein PRK78_004761 [Emydomyces testavorans]|uniref:Uncharacterized protein n=1 Tax=Emydomyces testavorans TaxID=2070801 RepID=A0AAF0IJW5_9EURO|nr:hypothetical protein PRK78_004761 [Emydomyces testavorans]